MNDYLHLHGYSEKENKGWAATGYQR